MHKTDRPMGGRTNETNINASMEVITEDLIRVNHVFDKIYMMNSQVSNFSFFS